MLPAQHSNYTPQHRLQQRRAFATLVLVLAVAQRQRTHQCTIQDLKNEEELEESLTRLGEVLKNSI
jgi:hypothetical protein